MTTDGLFTVKEFKIKNWPWRKPLRVIPWGDVHRDSPAFADEKWREFLARAKSKECKDSLFLCMGDTLDSFSSSERSILNAVTGLHDSTLENLEQGSRAKVRAFAKEIGFMKGRLIGILGGNHYSQFKDGTTSEQYLANLMGCSYLGTCSAIRLSVESGGCVFALDIFAHHGRGGGKTAGGRLKSVEDLAQIADADIFLMGHNHARGALPLTDRLRIVSGPKTGPYIRSRTPWIGRTGSFLKAYEHDHVSYVVDRALPPSNLGWIEFEINFKREERDGMQRLYVEIGARQ